MIQSLIAAECPAPVRGSGMADGEKYPISEISGLLVNLPPVTSAL
jgi:hypothetical protein